MSANIRIENTLYKDIPAISMDSKAIKAVFVTNHGGKMVSLFNKKTQRELLVQNPGKCYQAGLYGSKYIESECSGFDDMMPTIDECSYHVFPWKGTRIPDHGELWSMAWGSHFDLDELQLKVHGVRLPYVFSKRIRFIEDHIIEIAYTVENQSPFDMDFLWAAHFMAYVEPGDIIMLPPSVIKAETVLSKSGRMGQYGDIVAWPEFFTADGHYHRADLVRDYDVCDMEKYYVRNLVEGYCGINYSDGTSLRLDFPLDSVPYLGILLNENAWNGLHNVFLEPCTASFDRPDFARKRNECSRLKAAGSYTWNLLIGIN